MHRKSCKPDVIMVRRARGSYSFTLVPFDDRAVDAIGKLPRDEPVGIRIVRDRSLPQHRLFWAVLDHVGRATKFENAERLLVALKIRLGRYDLMKMPNGKIVPVPHSISFAAMTQDQFQTFMDEAVNLICSEVLPGTASETLLAEASAMLAPRPERTPPKDALGDMLRASEAVP